MDEIINFSIGYKTGMLFCVLLLAYTLHFARYRGKNR